jgi:hypothetical protein
MDMLDDCLRWVVAKEWKLGGVLWSYDDGFASRSAKALHKPKKRFQALGPIDFAWQEVEFDFVGCEEMACEVNPTNCNAK